MAINLAEKYVPVLDEVYKAASKTAILDGVAGVDYDFNGVDTVKLAKMELDGFGDYSKSNGYPNGSVSLTWETQKLTKDRAQKLKVDRMDNEETLGMAFGKVSAEFIRTQAVPEVDAYRFAKYAAAVTPVKADITIGTTDIPALIDTAEVAMGDAEVPEEGRILFISEKCYAALKQKITRSYTNENGINRQVEMYDGMQVIKVPQNRFNTAITLNDGSSSFGYAPTAGGYKINFMIVHPTAVKNVMKMALPKIFSPDENQTSDDWLFEIRERHDAFVFENKTAGIYVHCANTANA